MSQQSDPHETPRFTGIKTFFGLRVLQRKYRLLK